MSRNRPISPKAKVQLADRAAKKAALAAKPKVVKKAPPKPKPVKAVKAEAPKPPKVETALPEPVQAREDDGKFAADDPATPDVNEAFEGGKPLKPEYSDRMKKAELLSVADDLGVENVSMENTKAEIIAALDEA